MAGDENGLRGNACSSTERGKARRFLLGIPTFFLALTLINLDNFVPAARSVPPAYHLLPLALIITGVILQLSRPQGSERVGFPRILRHTARLAGLPERGAMIVLYGSVILAITTSVAALVVTMGATTP
jgi:hypothetical protein